jgi:YVTN family beta-propeller protein
MINMKMRYFFISMTAIAFGCSDDDTKPKGEYEHGVFIVNEGAFGHSSGSITYYNNTTSEIKQNILISSGAFAGDEAQSMTFEDNKGYLVLSGDNKIQIVDANTFENLGTIASSDIFAPRYMEVINDKAYISVWGPYDANYSLVNSYVLVYDLKTNATIKKIDTDEGTENLLYDGNYLFATNYNFGTSNTLSVINPKDNTLVKQIELAGGPSGMVIDAEGKLWVVCSDFVSGKLFKINTSSLTIEATINIAQAPNVDLAITPDKKNILYSIGNVIYKIPTNSTSEASQSFIDVKDAISLYSFNVNPDNGEIWIGDALDFTSAGKFFIYNPDGSFKTKGDAGIGPGQFIFK